MVEKKFSGWRAVSTVISPSPGSKYSGISFLGRAGDRFIEDDSTDAGITFRRSEWDGSDFVSFEDTLIKIVTERVVESFRAEGFTGADFDLIKVKR